MAVPRYDPFYHLVALPYLALRVPRLRLKIPSISLPSSTTVFLTVLFTYFLVVSGFIYDLIVAPPGMGGRQDASGNFIPEVFLVGRMNGQYIIEGLSAGMMLLFGGVGIIGLELACDKSRSKNTKMFFLAGGITLTVISYTMCMVFLRIKVPGYLH